MKRKQRIASVVGIVLLCVILSGCGIFGSSKRKRCLPCSKPRRSELLQQQQPVKQLVYLEQVNYQVV